MSDARTDRELVTVLAGGDSHALGELYDRHAPALLGVARQILRDAREAEDVVHDVFVEAWQRAYTYDPSRASVRSWLLVRLRSRCLDRLKRPSRSRRAPLEAAGEEEHARERRPATPADAGIERAQIREALTSLPDEQRHVLLLGYFRGLSSSEIATTLELPIGTVKSRVAAALRALRGRLGEAS